MTELRPVLVCPPLPPLRLDGPRNATYRSVPQLVFLLRGLAIVAALALPALGTRLLDPTGPGVTQAAIVPDPPPARTMAALLLR